MNKVCLVYQNYISGQVETLSNSIFIHRWLFFHSSDIFPEDVSVVARSDIFMMYDFSTDVLSVFAKQA